MKFTDKQKSDPGFLGLYARSNQLFIDQEESRIKNMTTEIDRYKKTIALLEKQIEEALSSIRYYSNNISEAQSLLANLEKGEEK